MTLNVSESSLELLRSTDLAELCSQIEWSDSAREFATPNSSFSTVLQSLVNHQYWIDAVSLLALALPPRASVWWAAIVSEQFLDAAADDWKTREQEAAVLAQARQWVLEPEDEQRQKTHDAAALLPNNVPSHWVGMAVFWATGNITPDAGVVTQPPAYLYARAVGAAINIASALSVPHGEAVFERALRSGLDIASGGDGRLTPDAPPAA